MGENIQLTAADGFELGAYRARPDGTPRGGVVVIQEIFGVNVHIRAVCDRYADAGYLAVAPAIYDRVEPDVQIGYTAEDVTRGPPKRWYNRVMTTGDRVIAISQFIAEHMVAEYKSDRSRIRVIYRGIDTELFDPAKVSDGRVIKLAADWRLPDGVPIVMLPGRLTRWKGQRVLIEALARLDNVRLRCLIVGDDQGRTGYRREIEGLIRDRGLDGTVHLMGDCPDMPAAYKLADVVVSASTDPEAFGRIMVEAQAMGTPVIASDHGASRELLLENETGWLFPPGDAAALAERVEAAIGLDSASRERIAERAMANARAKFSKEDMCTATLEVYREVIAKTASNAGPVAA